MSAAPLDDRGLPHGYTFRPEFEVLPRAVREAIAQAPARALLVDVRSADERRLACIAGSLHVPLDELERRLDEIEQAAAALGDAPVYTHCHHGVRSLKAALFLRERGLDETFSMAGGIDVWSQDVDPKIARYQRDAAGGWSVLPGR